MIIDSTRTFHQHRADNIHAAQRKVIQGVPIHGQPQRNQGYLLPSDDIEVGAFIN